MWIAWVGLAFAADPMAGVEFVPFSRADAVQIADGRRTGTGVGEFDGTVWPSLRAFGGAWVSERIGITGHLGLAVMQTSSWSGEHWVRQHLGVVRPGADLRISVLKRSDERPHPLVVVGAYGDIPTASVGSDGFSGAERDQARDDASRERARLGGVGARVGAGVDHRVHRNIVLGFLWSVRGHRAVVRTAETASVSGWWGSEVGLTFTFEWPSKSE
jgi:hypothetical protein